MTNTKKLFLSFLSATAVFLLLFAFFFFAYFIPVKKEHARIAELPSHDLSLFLAKYGRSVNSSMTKEDVSNALNNDTFTGSAGYCYFYDAENNLFMKLGTDTHFWAGDGHAMYYIEEYVPFALYYDGFWDPFRRGLGLGPVLCRTYELSGSQSHQVGTIAESRYWFLYQFSLSDTEVSVFSVSLQLALAFALYCVPLIACLFWRKKKTLLCAAGIYLLAGAANIAYYFANYPWLSW